MKRLIGIAVIVLVAAVVAIAATTRTSTSSVPSAKPPTTASLMPAYVAAARYWQHRQPALQAKATRSEARWTTAPRCR